MQAIYLIISSNKGISSVVLARRYPAHGLEDGTRYPKMMDPNQSDAGLLTGVVELDEMYVEGNPRPQDGVKHKRGKGL